MDFRRDEDDQQQPSAEPPLRQRKAAVNPHRDYAKPGRGPIRGMRSAAKGCEIVEVKGRHIIKPTGRKDRHSKVYTAKGQRDRRVRLAAHTAIQFYDVQDRLGYDRPSKAVDWLIDKAQHAIHNLSHLPPFHPGGNDQQEPAAAAGLDPQTSFFAMATTESQVGSQSGYPGVQGGKDLCLSLQSFQDGGFIHCQPELENPESSNSQTLYPVSSGWLSEANPETGMLKLLGWSGGGEASVGYGERGALIQSTSFHPPPSIRPWNHYYQKMEEASMAGINEDLGPDGFVGFRMHSAADARQQ